MARNRKTQVPDIRLGSFVKALLFCAAFVAPGIGYVYEKEAIRELGHQITLRESRLAELQVLNHRLREEKGRRLAPTVLDQTVKDMKLGLAPPQPAQVWRLPEPPVENSAAPRDSQYAADLRDRAAVR
jgi:hypothetical protein